MWSICFVHNLDPALYKHALSPVSDSHYKDMTVAKPSIFCNGNTHAWNDGFILDWLLVATVMIWEMLHGYEIRFFVYLGNDTRVRLYKSQTTSNSICSTVW